MVIANNISKSLSINNGYYYNKKDQFRYMKDQLIRSECVNNFIIQKF